MRKKEIKVMVKWEKTCIAHENDHCFHRESLVQTKN